MLTEYTKAFADYQNAVLSQIERTGSNNPKLAMALMGLLEEHGESVRSVSRELKSLERKPVRSSLSMKKLYKLAKKSKNKRISEYVKKNIFTE